jgi:hypothetical protein
MHSPLSVKPFAIDTIQSSMSIYSRLVDDEPALVVVLIVNGMSSVDLLTSIDSL